MTFALIADMRQPEAPKPINARPITNVGKACAYENTSAPPAAINSNAASVRLGPKRSSSSPSGS
jgi:hypothetical protein